MPAYSVGDVVRLTCDVNYPISTRPTLERGDLAVVVDLYRGDMLQLDPLHLEELSPRAVRAECVEPTSIPRLSVSQADIPTIKGRPVFRRA